MTNGFSLNITNRVDYSSGGDHAQRFTAEIIADNKIFKNVDIAWIDDDHDGILSPQDTLIVSRSQAQGDNYISIEYKHHNDFDRWEAAGPERIFKTPFQQIAKKYANDIGLEINDYLRSR